MTTPATLDPHKLPGYDYIDLRDSLLGEALETLASATAVYLDIPEAPLETLNAVAAAVKAWDGDRGMIATTRHVVAFGSLDPDEVAEDKTVFDARSTVRLVEVTFQLRPSLGDLFELDDLLTPLVSPARPIARTYRSLAAAA